MRTEAAETTEHGLNEAVEGGRPIPHGDASSAYTDWPGLLAGDWEAWRRKLGRSKGGPRVLIATGVGGWAHIAMVDSLIGVALTLRGAEVHVLLCDGVLSACEFLTIHDSPLESFAEKGAPAERCSACYANAARMYQDLGLTVHGYGDFLTDTVIQEASCLSWTMPVEQLTDYAVNGVRVGEHALAGALRFFAVGTLDNEPYAEPVLRRYLHAAILACHAIRQCLATRCFASTSFHHGIYVPQGVLGDVARIMGVRVVNWVVAYRKKSFIFSHGDTYHHTMMSEPVSAWEQMDWSDQHESDIMDYLQSRRKGERDWIWFHERPEENTDRIVQETGIDLDRPMIGLLTNVIWDAQLHYPANAFPDMLSWVNQTIRYFETRPDLQLVIRIHPAELRGTVKSRQLIATEIENAFPRLPKNVFVVSPDSRISTYALTSLCNAVIIYGTKTGVELTSFGIPVIVAGEAWIRNKGVTFDASSPDEYIELLDNLPFLSSLDDATKKRARKYAYHFFFRRMIPIQSISPLQGWPPYGLTANRLDDLLEGRDLGVDIICNGILNGTEFIYPAEALRNPMVDP